MSGAKDVSTPLSTTQSLKLIDGTAAVDNFEFRRIIGRLQYLSLTRPDISFFSQQTFLVYAQANYKSLDNNKKASPLIKANHFSWYSDPQS